MAHQMRVILAAVLVRLVAGRCSDGICHANTSKGHCGASCARRDSLLLQVKTAVVASPHEGRVNVTHQLVGCFPRSGSDTDDEPVFQDSTCANATSVSNSSEDGPCRSGLPFFRFALHKEQSYLDCFTFCLSKGLDLCGVVYSERASADECRCGATPLNQGVWGGTAPHSRLLLPESLVPQDDDRCKVIVWQYNGGLENAAVPTPLMHQSLGDQAYVDGIVHQVDPDTIMEEEEPDDAEAALQGPGNATTEQRASLVQDTCRDNNDAAKKGIGYSCQQLEGFCSDATNGPYIRATCPITCKVCSQKWGWLPCYPQSCGPGSHGPWPKNAQKQLIVNYYYDSTVGGTTKAAFEKAKGEWQSRTCVRFQYSQSRPTIKVTAANKNDCSSGVGFPGRQGTLKMNLGWCKDDRHLYNMVHELGHALGMNHENKRPDAAPGGVPDGNGYRSGKFYTAAGYKGPYLNVNWGQISPKSQWTPNTRSYIGSQNVGYASYDYGSLMHYRLTSGAKLASGKNQAWESVIGQRDRLSEGDIKQFKDMYGC